MPLERAFVGGAVAVVVVALVAAVFAPGAVAPPSDDERAGPVRIADVALQPTRVGGSTVDLNVGVAAEHFGNPTENVSIRIRAIDAETGFLAVEKRVPVGNLTGEGQTRANATLTVERQGGYRIEVSAFRGDELTDRTHATVSGLDSLTPAYAQTDVSFADEPALPSLSVAVAETDDNRTRLRIDAALTNRGDAPSGDLALTVVLRQADSNLVADRAEVSAPNVRSGRTETVEATVSVPSEYNYYVDAVLWKDGVVVDSARSVVNLAPTETVSVDEQKRSVNLSVGDFERDREDGARREPTEAADATGGNAPGFTVGATVAALVAVAALAAARTRRRF